MINATSFHCRHSDRPFLCDICPSSTVRLPLRPLLLHGDGESGECQPIPSEDVKIDGANYEIALKPGDHRMATRLHLFFVPQSKAMMSVDGFYHLCFFPNEDVVCCFYAPQMNF